MAPRYYDDDAEPGPSRTTVKNAATELQELAAALLTLPQARLDEVPMEDNLREALAQLRRLKGFEAIRRHMQYIGKLTRDAEAEPFRRALDNYQRGQRVALKEAEVWRERLLADDAALTDWLHLHPTGDTRQLRTLIRKARQEQAAAGESGTRGQYFRELFQTLKVVLENA